MNMKKVIAIVMVLVLALSVFTACGDKDEDGNKAINVTVSIDFPEDQTDIKSVKDAKVKAYENNSVLEVLMKYIEDNEDGIQLYLGPGGTYVMGMGGVMEDEDAGTGWVYELNGEAVMVGATEQVVKDGDSIVWKFKSFGTTNDDADDNADDTADDNNEE